jgi:hypothetical protein
LITNIPPIKEKRNRGNGVPFTPGFDPRRNLNGARKGSNPLILLKKRAVEKHTEDIMEIIERVMNQAKQGNEKSQSLVLEKFLTTVLTDLSVESCEEDPSSLPIEGVEMLTKEDELEIKAFVAQKIKTRKDIDG